MSGADNREDPRRTARGHLAQARRHETIAFGDQRFVDLRSGFGELRERGFEQVAFLETFDLVFIDILVHEYAREETGKQVETPPPRHVTINPLQGCADFAIDEFQRTRLFARRRDRGVHLRPGFDIKLLRNALLKRTHREHRGNHRCAPRFDDLEQIHLLQRFGVFHGLETARAQFDGDGVPCVFRDFLFYRGNAGTRHVRGAEQSNQAAADLDILEWLLAVVFSRCCIHQVFVTSTLNP